MAVRPINAINLKKYIKGLDVSLPYDKQDKDDVIRQVCCIIDNWPTLTPPNKWVSMETPPTEQGWYHVAILDLKTGEYKVEQDLYSIELAKIHGFEPGFCKARRWEERERIDYWCRFPSPPDRRPPEGEEDT